MKAVIMAGGKGMRMRPYTSVLPKPLMPVGDLPIIEIILRQLAHAGVNDVVITIGYLGSLLQTYLAQSPISQRLKISYHLESEPLGTAGALGGIEPFEEPFFVLNGDLLSNVDYADMFRYHRDCGASLTVGVVETEVQIQLGVLTLDVANTITGYDEKPTMSYAASMGIYVFSPEAKAMIEPNQYLDAPALVLKLIEAGKRVVGYKKNCCWIDIGNPLEYQRAQEEFAEDPGKFLPR